MSSFTTFIPREIAVRARYKAIPGNAQRTTASAETISRGKPRWSPNTWIAAIRIAAVSVDWTSARRTARRNSTRLRARSPTACDRAINVVMASSRPNTPILLIRSVIAQATANVPRTAGPSSRATRNVKTPRKFDARSAIVLKKAPRFSSEPVSSTGSATSGDGAARSVLSSALIDLGCCHSPANWFDANALTQSVCPVSRESGHARGRFLYYIYHISWRNRTLIHSFRRNALDVTAAYLTLALILSRRYNRVLGPPNFF